MQAPAQQTISVTLSTEASDTEYSTRARSVGAFLQERGLTPLPDDYLSLPLDAPLSEGSRIAYRPAVAIELRSGGEHVSTRSSAPTVAAFLATRGIILGALDEVTPALDAALHPGATIRIVRVSHISTTTVRRIAPHVVHHFDPTLAAGSTRTLDAGRSGLRETTVRVERRDDGSAPLRSSYSHTVRAPRAKILAVGTRRGSHAVIEAARLGIAAAGRLAENALRMIATAYTAGCYGCSGITAMGQHAGHGIVAVDPRVIPLGTKLYVPGYGRAVAGDTGGDIRGRRIDLGFNSLAEAVRFGRREITVYVLR